VVLHKCDVCGQTKESIFRLFAQGSGWAHKRCGYTKKKQTCLQKYGVDNPRKSEKVKQKIRKTWLVNYGTDHPWKNAEVKEKRDQTWKKKYKVGHPWKSARVKQKIRQTKIRTQQHWTDQRVSNFVCQFGCTLLEWGGNVHKKSRYKCLKGHIWQMPFYAFIAGRRCSICRQSRGEGQIAHILESHDIDFVRQYRLEKGKNSLSLDFYIPSLNIGIEYDGQHHFEPVQFGGISAEKAMENLRIQQQRDKRKKHLCHNRGYNLVRIRYDDEDIKQMLQVILSAKHNIRR
jgi:very-short-patch-repair endonuclease